MSKYLISYIQINTYTNNEVNRSTIYECDGQMTEEELEKAEEFLTEEKNGRYVVHILSFSLLEKTHPVQKVHTTWVWAKLFDKKSGEEVPVYINKNNIKMITARENGGLFIVVRGEEKGKMKLASFIVKSKNIYFTENESTEGVPSSWLDESPVEPSVFYDGWLTLTNEKDYTPVN